MFNTNMQLWISALGAWDGNLSIPLAGDFNGGGRADVATLHDMGNSQTEIRLIR